MYVTILRIDKNNEEYAKILEACKWMVEHDKNKNFVFIELPDGGIKIFSPGRNQAFKRGTYFHQKHKVSYEVIWDKNA